MVQSNMVKMDFSRLLKTQRAASGLTQLELARLAGISVWHWARLERQGAIKNPKLTTVARVINALKFVTKVSDQDERDLLVAAGHSLTELPGLRQIEKELVADVSSPKRVVLPGTFDNLQTEFLSESSTRPALERLISMGLNPSELKRLDDVIASFIDFLATRASEPLTRPPTS